MVARTLDRFGINRLGLKLQERFFGSFIRAVNYHVVRPEDADSLEAHLRYYEERFVSVDLESLEKFLVAGEWPHSRPGLIISFDDGDRTHYEVAAPLLEKYGFTGWFFVPIGLMNLNEVHGRPVTVLTLDQLKYLNDRHVVGSHSETHCRLGSDNSFERLESEICGSRRHLEQLLGTPVEIFCWVGGEETSYSSEAAKLISENYKYSFMTNNAVIRPGDDPLQLQRTNIEAENPLELVRFQLSGLMDVYYTGKRRRVNRLTARGRSRQAA